MYQVRRLRTKIRRGQKTLAFAAAMIVHVSGVPAQTAEIRLVALPSESPSDTVAILPNSSARFLTDGNFVVEVWAQTADARGLSSVSSDIAFTNTLASITSITHTATFSVLTAGTVNNANGTIDNLSGSHLGPCSDAIAVSPTWARVASFGVSASASGSLTVQSGPANSAIYGVAICGLGNIADAQVLFGSVAVDLVECLTDGECVDGQFCNGAETCNLTTFTCEPGTPSACDDNVVCTVDACDPLANGGAGGCQYAPDDGICDNLLFCDGVETCDAIQGCLPGLAPCAAECEHCVEASDACELCIFDQDSSGVMGTGDFSLFAPCFGACYTAGHPCLASNFDKDAGGCVGTSDFAAFAGCFGFACGQCAGCAGPGGGGGAAGAAGSLHDLDSSGVIVRLTARTTPSTSDILEALPQSEANFAVGDRIYVEAWASIRSSGPAPCVGLASAYVDLQFSERRLVPQEVISSDALGLFASRSLSAINGVLQAVGGCAKLDRNGVGADGNWIRVTTIVVRAASPGRTQVTVGPSDELHGFSGAGKFENIDASLIDFNGTTVDVHKKHRHVRDEW